MRRAFSIRSPGSMTHGWHLSLPARFLGFWSTMKVIAFLTDYAVVDRIINHLPLTIFAERPPPPQIAYQEILMAAEDGAEYLS
jgi:hypothetical protein